MPTSHAGGTSHRLHKKLANPFDENTGTTQGIGWVQRRLIYALLILLNQFDFFLISLQINFGGNQAYLVSTMIW